MSAAETTRPSRQAAGDRGQRACTRLLIEAERLSAEKGYAKASTREICAAAGLNVAAIHYHFPVSAAAVAQHFVPQHRAMALMPARHIGLTAPDDDVHRLCFAHAHAHAMTTP